MKRSDKKEYYENLIYGLFKKKKLTRGEKIEVKKLRKVASYAYGKVLDVGFAQTPNIFLSNVTGLDIKLPEKIPVNYSKTIRGNAQELSRYFKNESFDCIVASDVIEHLENHVKFLKECHKCLMPGGLLIISTDNPYRWKTLLGNLFFPKGLMSNEEHLNYLPPRLLNRTAKTCGFALEKMGCSRGINLPGLQKQYIYVYRRL